MIYKKILFCMIFIVAIGLFTGCTAGRVEEIPDKPNPQPTLPEKDPIEEQIKLMSLDQKLGQMLMAGLTGFEADDNTKQLIENYNIGGFILYGSNVKSPEQLLALTNSLKSINGNNILPLFISVDEEGGRISRMPKALKNIPSAKAIGKINNQEFSYKLGELLALKIKAFGINMNFAPVLDINSNPKNPVIGDRAFGAEEKVVSELGVQTMKGIEAEGVIPVVKHFPGHGDTSIDSHIGLPKINNDMARLRSFELIPFAKAIESGADVVMAAHILLPKIDPENPATLSKAIITDMLREQMGFDGVVITDDMTMGAIAKNYDLGAAAVKSIEAGSDIILVAHGNDNALNVLKSLKEAVKGGVISEERINQSIYRILTLKHKYNLKDEEIKLENIEELNDKINTVLDSYMK